MTVVTEAFSGGLSFGQRTRIAVGQAFRVSVESTVAVTTWPSALRRGLLVGLIALIALLTNHQTQGFAIAIGALNLGLVDGVIPKRSLAQVFTLVTIGTGVVCFVSSMVAGTWWSLLLLVVLAYVYGCLSGSGFIAMHAAMITLITGIVFSNDPGDLQQAATAAVCAVIGCVIQAASGLLAWRYDRKAAMRRSLGTLLQSIAALARFGVPNSDLAYRAATREMAAERMLTSGRFDPQVHDYYANIIRRANWFRMALATWATLPEESTTRIPAYKDAIAEILTELDARLRSTHRHAAELPALPRDDDPIWNTVVDRLVGLIEAVNAPIAAHSSGTPDTSVANRAESGRSLGDRIMPWLALLKPGGGRAQHGMRLALAMGIAQTLTLALHIDRGYWLSVTVLICLQPDFASTLTHGALRAVGTLGGVLVIGIATWITDGSALILTLIVLVATPLVMKLQTANYGLEAFFITCVVAGLLESVDPSDQTLWLRLSNTLAGFAIALAVYLVWPKWKSDGLSAGLTKVIDTHRVWMNSVLQSLRSPASADTAKLRALGLEARNISLTVRPDAEAAVIEPHRIEQDPRAALELLDACHTFGLAALAIEATIRDRGRDLQPVDSDSIRERLDQTLVASTQLINHNDAAQSQPQPIEPADIPRTNDGACNHSLNHLISTVSAIYLTAQEVEANE